MTEKGLKPSILLVDDNQDVLDGLHAHLAKLLPGNQVDIRKWLPTKDEDDPEIMFERKVDNGTVIVATDYDLTSKGVKGLFGLTVVGWCQEMSIPVGNFSRRNDTTLPKEPNLFELRVPPADIEGARFIASAFHGFHTIREMMTRNPDLISSGHSLATLLTTLLGRPHLDNQFALYLPRLGSGSSTLVQRLRESATGNALPGTEDKAQILTYMLGHVLLNSILKFPGPILSVEALCSYVATSQSEADALHGIFEPAIYKGPFGEDDRYYWREDVDNILYQAGASVADKQFEDFGDFNRAAIEAALLRPLAAHTCPRDRCGGRKGGFLCPFTHRPVCERGDCSVSASSWIPQGAQLSRVERDFYDEWAPLLGL